MEEIEQLRELLIKARKNSNRISVLQFEKFMEDTAPVYDFDANGNWEDVYTNIRLKKHLYTIPGNNERWLVYTVGMHTYGIFIGSVHSIFEFKGCNDLMLFDYMYATFALITNECDGVKRIYVYDHQNRGEIITDIIGK